MVYKHLSLLFLAASFVQQGEASKSKTGTIGMNGNVLEINNAANEVHGDLKISGILSIDGHPDMASALMKSQSDVARLETVQQTASLEYPTETLVVDTLDVQITLRGGTTEDTFKLSDLVASVAELRSNQASAVEAFASHVEDFRVFKLNNSETVVNLKADGVAKDVEIAALKLDLANVKAAALAADEALAEEVGALATKHDALSDWTDASAACNAEGQFYRTKRTLIAKFLDVKDIRHKVFASDGSTKMAQVFKALNTGVSSAVELPLCWNEVAQSWNIFVELYATGDDGLPTDDPIATSVKFSAKSVLTNQPCVGGSRAPWHRFVFSTGVKLEEGTDYALALAMDAPESIGTNNNNNIGWSRGQNTEYTQGHMVPYKGSSKKWSLEAGYDLAFKVEVALAATECDGLNKALANAQHQVYLSTAAGTPLRSESGTKHIKAIPADESWVPVLRVHFAGAHHSVNVEGSMGGNNWGCHSGVTYSFRLGFASTNLAHGAYFKDGKVMESNFASGVMDDHDSIKVRANWVSDSVTDIELRLAGGGAGHGGAPHWISCGAQLENQFLKWNVVGAYLSIEDLYTTSWPWK
jgi:hypothetical protein